MSKQSNVLDIDSILYNFLCSFFCFQMSMFQHAKMYEMIVQTRNSFVNTTKIICTTIVETFVVSVICQKMVSCLKFKNKNFLNIYYMIQARI